ncbi:MAG: tetratricopeptide repeat protein [Candidatus Cybelea sp.]
MRTSTAAVALVAAAALGAAWPWFSSQRAQATGIPTAPISMDYLQRDRFIAFDEAQARRDPSDQITRRMLASEYLARFRETGDLNDVTRAYEMATRSLSLQPQGNAQALGVIASSDIVFHHFSAALAAERASLEGDPSNDDARAQSASILMELGRYEQAGQILMHPPDPDVDPTWISIRARYDEVTGNLSGARVVMTEATQQVDRMISIPAYTRSWYHLRDAQLAFEAGDGETADSEFTQALRIYPDNAMALLYQAKLYRAHHDWQRALAAATRSAELYPLPQALGYEADAQRALGDEDGASRTDALIAAEQRLFNVQGINDRLLAMYYAEHREHLDDALAAARSDIGKRGNEIYADDTMAWVLATMGRWKEARVYAVRAARYDTAEPELQYHCGVIALHTGHFGEARRRLSGALAVDRQFHPVYADDARRILIAVSK